MTSATLAYLQALRRQQLGEDVGDLAALETAAKEANAVAVKPGRAKAPKMGRLHITTYARRRMSQRGLRIEDVLAIYMHGEAQRDRNEPTRTRYRMTERALEHLDGARAKSLRRLMGDIVVIADPDGPGRRPALITVIPFGEDSR